MTTIQKEFEEYINHKTKYAINRLNNSPINPTHIHDLVTLFQAQWAREFYFNKCISQK